MASELPKPKLRGARDRKRRAGAKVEGRKSIAEQRPETVELARRLARARPKGGKRSLREISAALAEAGHTTNTGKPYAPTRRVPPLPLPEASLDRVLLDHCRELGNKSFGWLRNRVCSQPRVDG
jgi:hypothetical protein